jgi:hypothetical protein
VHILPDNNIKWNFISNSAKYQASTFVEKSKGEKKQQKVEGDNLFE